MSKTKEEVQTTGKEWETMDMDAYVKANLKHAITFLQQCLTIPAVHDALIAANEDYRSKLIDFAKEQEELKKAEKNADSKKVKSPNG